MSMDKAAQSITILFQEQPTWLPNRSGKTLMQIHIFQQYIFIYLVAFWWRAQFPEKIKLTLLWNRVHCLQCIDFYKENIWLQICYQETILSD